MSRAGLQGLPRLSGLLCGNHGSFPGAVKCLFFATVCHPCPLQGYSLASLIPDAVAYIVPLPSCSTWTAASSAVVLLSVFYLWSPGLPPPFQQLVQVLLIRYNSGTGCMTSFHPDIRETARLHSFPYGSGVSETPPPHQSCIH